jgi:serine/threonine protein kinase/Tol biopolymer transport system component
MLASLYCAQCGALNQPEAGVCFACGRSLDDPAPAATDARRVIGGRYRLVRQLGVGGFGAVYQAEDTTLGHRLVALKEMSPRGLSPQEAQEATDAFQREALLLAGLAHPSLPRIYERFEEEGRWYLVMDFIEGETLDVYLDRQGGSVPVKEALQLALQLCDVLGYLHSRQPPIIFRDLKPSNIMRSPEGQVTLVDFGIARFFKPGQSKDTIAFGSPGYAAPEQYGKAQTTPRSDIFSLGAVLHQMLTGSDPSEKPFRFAPLTMPRPAGLSLLIERMVRMEESQRPPSMESIQRELASLLDERSSWSTDDLARTGAPLAAGLVAQPAGYVSPFHPWATPQPALKKSKSDRWVIWLALMLLLVGPLALGGLGVFWHTFHSVTVIDGPSNTNGGGSAATVPVYTLAWSPDGTRIASAGGDDKVEIWAIDSSQPGVSIETNAAKTTELAWSPDGSYLASLDNGVVDLWNVSNNTSTYVSAFEPAVGLVAFAWSPTGEQMALAFNNGNVLLMNVLTKATHLLFANGQNGSANVIAWSPDGKYIAAGGTTHEVDVWDSGMGYQVYSDEGYTGDITSLAWSPNSQQIAAADTAGPVHVWDALTGDHAFVYPGDASVMNTVAWSPDGNYLAAGDQKGAIQVWMSSSTTPVIIYTLHTDAVQAVAWSPDGKRIASAGNDGAVQICDALTGKDVASYQQP